MPVDPHAHDATSGKGNPAFLSATPADLFEGTRSEVANIRKQLGECIESLREELAELERSMNELSSVGDVETCRKARSLVKAQQRRNSNARRDDKPKTESDAENTRFGKNHPLFAQATLVVRSLLLQGRRPLSAGAIKTHLNTRGGIPEFQVGSKSVGNRLLKMGMRRVVSVNTGEDLWWPAGTDIPAGYR